MSPSTPSILSDHKRPLLETCVYQLVGSFKRIRFPIAKFRKFWHLILHFQTVVLSTTKLNKLLLLFQSLTSKKSVSSWHVTLTGSISNPTMVRQQVGNQELHSYKRRIRRHSRLQKEEIWAHWWRDLAVNPKRLWAASNIEHSNRRRPQTTPGEYRALSLIMSKFNFTKVQFHWMVQMLSQISPICSNTHSKETAQCLN